MAEVIRLEVAGGGGYYTNCIGYTVIDKNWNALGGLTGGPCIYDRLGTSYYKDVGGSGGRSGAGGTVYYANMKNIFAYNGDMITTEKEEDYEKEYYEYDKNGTKNIENKLAVITKPNGKKTIPAKIFAQSGIIRETYTSNTGAYTLSKVTRNLDSGEHLPAIATSYATIVPVRATNETATDTTGYNNGYMQNQGIGSGAGYLEDSNGTFEKIT